MLIFTKGKHLAKNDPIVVWSRSVMPQWISKEDREKLPKELRFPEIGDLIEEPGRKQLTLVIVTKMLGEKDSGNVSK